MSEHVPSQNEQRDPRPIGRFLLGLEAYRGVNDPVAFAAEFAARHGNFAKYKHKSVKVDGLPEVLIDGRKVELEFSVSKYAYIWKIIVFAEAHRVEDLNTNYIPHGGEQYELHCSQPKSHGKYREYDGQRRPHRERDIESIGHLRILQGLVEHMVMGDHLSSNQET